jgi:hypothetical protein
MVSAVITSTLAGVCRRARLRRLPLAAVWLRVSVGAAGDAGGAVDAAAAVRFFRERADWEALVPFDRR